MLFNTAQQPNLIAEIQAFTRKIHYVVHTDDSQKRVEILLKTDDPVAAQLLPQLREVIVAGVVNMLYYVLAITGERV